ncbi:ubiquitin C-terminal hydrolase-like protein [Cucurbitaria berberidis CBS 394.84]|uniref:ubiquitinyl hydrolase 1 n=1 Tax=Cucurbitaria berberidis CBS 394.84 TaxID=1168544 RepID=A0A9P4GEJ6_9PLEO|nr:ubiquitin C-terminal hydrolase-like protein [Cucurbitaria berberidis CBS 394.84]KAF1843760.1 ubiquitin C-terminal hydrolase-like protein [Cucurbitaria berberidis CBS 394.84]
MAPGKTAPRLLQDLLTYDPRYEEKAGSNSLTSAPPQHNPNGEKVRAVPFRNCRHALHTKNEQSQLPVAGEAPDHSTKYKVASYCSQCRWHIDVVLDFCDDGSKNRPCKQGDMEYFLHHFLFESEDNTSDNVGLSAQYRPRTYQFRCSAPSCPVLVRISFKPPRLSEQDIETLTDGAQLRRRWEAAKQIAGERVSPNMARRVDAPDFLYTYLQDSLNPVKGKTRIPLLNRKFLTTFGKDCDSILKRLGFTKELEREDDGTMAEAWYLPRLDESENSLESPLRNVIEDARYELNTVILAFDESERTGCRHQALYPTPSRGNIERILGCDDYDKVKGRIETRSTNHEEDHPHYAGLGAVGDFSDALVLFAFSRQAEQDMVNQFYYFECLKDIALGRKSDDLGTQVAVLASKGLTTKTALEFAYQYFNIDPSHAGVISDEHIIGCFKALLPDISSSQADEARKQLRVLGDARNSDKIRVEASDTIETEEQAFAWLELDSGTTDDFIQTMFSIKTQDNPTCLDTARKAVLVIANKRQSQRLRDFLDKGTMSEPEMDVGEAYALFQVDNRTLALDLDVLKTTVDVANPGDVEKLQKAFAIIQQDQAQNHNNRIVGASQPEARRNSYPLETWPVGLRNIGNTCYLNSVLQFLFTIKPLRELILKCDEYMEDPSPDALKDKKVGRTVVTADRVITAQKFVRELRTFFEQMVNAPTDTVQPALDLAALALCRTDRPEEPKDPLEVRVADNAGLGLIEGVAVSGPTPAPNGDTHAPSFPDSVMAEDKDDAKSVSSMQAMDLGDENDIPAPPTRPPPIPPRPEAQAKADQTKTKIGIVEESARQQDAAEVMGNIFDLISCAIKGEDVLREGEQLDTIKKLFFSDVTTVRDTAKGAEKLSELRHNYLVSPGWRDRPLYATLDDDFGQSEMEGGATRYEYIDKAAPILVINVRRIQWVNELVYDRAHISLDHALYLDRYLGRTNSLDEAQLLKLREAQWEKQQELREIDVERKRLQATEIEGMNLADSIEETSAFINSLSTEQSQQEQQGVDSLPTPPPELADTLHEKAERIKKDLEDMDFIMSKLESQIDTVFRDCNDHPYRLHAVFTHRGGVRGGHYWIYIYDFQNGLWRMYNDDHVTIADEKQIFEPETGVAIPKASTGVVYIRADLVDEFTQAVCRNPKVEETDRSEDPETQSQDVVMQDLDDEKPPPLEPINPNELPVLVGVEKQ